MRTVCHFALVNSQQQPSATLGLESPASVSCNPGTKRTLKINPTVKRHAP
ncbi:hypothetical protein LIA77_06104 [Sarocladium implicatum]|nr:hypothetical protein LIA77_06104 [Sarocladium implicatum]